MRQDFAKVRQLALVAAVSAIGLSLAGCEDSTFSPSAKATQPVPAKTMALMNEKGVSVNSPVLIRTFKKEAELEIWKQKPDGTYVFLKTFPMCRWSGQLGPKKREGDRQVPEGFYTITPGQMNPNSAYYLSFNVGYPNAYDRAYGRSGGAIMVHGICSSAGCYSMTNQQMGEIYAITREAFHGGQRAIQMESFPFHMTAENLAKHRLDPNMPFWRNLKEGSDHFEITKREPQVGVCGKRYVFDVQAANGGRLDPVAACPPLKMDEQLAAEVSAKEAKDERDVASLVASGVKPIELVYQDGGQNPEFRDRVTEMSRPEAIAEGPTEVVLDNNGKPIKTPAPVQQASAPAAKVASAAPAAASPAPASGGLLSFTQAPETTPATFKPTQTASAGTVSSFFKKWLPFGQDDTTASNIPVSEPASPQPADVPVPPHRLVTSVN